MQCLCQLSTASLRYCRNDKPSNATVVSEITFCVEFGGTRKKQYRFLMRYLGVAPCETMPACV